MDARIPTSKAKINVFFTLQALLEPLHFFGKQGRFPKLHFFLQILAYYAILVFTQNWICRSNYANEICRQKLVIGFAYFRKVEVTLGRP